VPTPAPMPLRFDGCHVPLVVPTVVDLNVFILYPTPAASAGATVGFTHTAR